MDLTSLTCSRKELEDRIFEVPREALSRECSLGDFSLKTYPSYLSLYPPYLARLALDNGHPFFPAEGKVGVYLGHFMPISDFLQIWAYWRFFVSINFLHVVTVLPLLGA